MGPRDGKKGWMGAVVGLLWALGACAGAGTPGKPPGDASQGTDGVSSAKPDATAAQTDAPSGPRKPSCTDGSCFECGDGICPAGFYCEASKAGSGCGWAPSCAQKPTCACLTPQLKGCSCEERAGFPHVTCSGG